MMIVSSPRPAGQPKKVSMAMNNSNIDRPVTTSGITNGAEAMTLRASLPPKLPNRVKAKAINTPKNVEIVAAHTATYKDLPTAASNWSLFNRDRYHFVENPAQTETNLLSLKL